MLKKKTTTLLITVALLTSVMPAHCRYYGTATANADTVTMANSHLQNLTELNPTVSNHRKC